MVKSSTIPAAHRTGRPGIRTALRDLCGRRTDVKIIGLKSSEVPRTHDEALEFASKYGARVAIWGEVISVGGETEIQAYFAIPKAIWTLASSLSSDRLYALLLCLSFPINFGQNRNIVGRRRYRSSAQTAEK